eukprot:3690399-Rhodomonas_salina.1
MPRSQSTLYRERAVLHLISQRMLLRACYAMPGTDLVYLALFGYARATRCPVLTSRTVRAMSCTGLSSTDLCDDCYSTSGTQLGNV